MWGPESFCHDRDMNETIKKSPTVAPGPEPMLESTARTLAMWTHLSGALSPLIGIPGVIAALVFWLIGKDRSALVDDQGKEAVNFHLSLIIWSLIFALPMVIITILTLGLALLAFGAVLIAVIVIEVQAAMAASRGAYYRYPINWRLIH